MSCEAEQLKKGFEKKLDHDVHGLKTPLHQMLSSANNPVPAEKGEDPKLSLMNLTGRLPV